MVNILSFTSMIMREVMGDDDFWNALQCGEAEHRRITYSKESNFGYFSVCLEYPDIVTLKDWFGVGIVADDISQRYTRKQLFEKLSAGDYRSEENAISVLVTDAVYGKISVGFSSHLGDEVLEVRFVA